MIVGLARRGLRHRARRDHVIAMEELYMRRLGMARQDARRALNRAVERMSDKHPEKPLEWILDKLLTDLERARR